MTDKDTELASDFTIGRFLELEPRLTDGDKNAWDELLLAMRRRIDERFLKPIHELARFDKRDHLPMRPGFAIVALDCLLIDTIQSFREGRLTTGEVSPAQSFKTFLSSRRFSDFKPRERGDFYNYVRNAVFHNGETRKEWKIRIDTERMVYRDPITGTKTINRRLLHAAVIQEWRQLLSELRSGQLEARKQFLQRVGAMAGEPIEPLRNFYFAYGSNLLQSECCRTAQDAKAYGKAFLPGYKIAFTKHSKSRGGDAATVVPDEGGNVWGFVYRVHDKDKERLQEREGGYELSEVTVYLVESGDEWPTPLDAFTFASAEKCPQRCGPPEAYLELILKGATDRELPKGYNENLATVAENSTRTWPRFDVSS